MIRYIGKNRATYSKLSVSVLVLSEDKKKISLELLKEIFLW